MMLLTVIIPTFNRADMIGRAIASVLQQSDAIPLDIVIVDDGSIDETASIVASLIALHPEIRYIRQDNAGVSGARNTGLRNLLPQTTLVTFLDSDDALPQRRLSFDLPWLANDATLDLTYARMSIVDDVDHKTLRPTPASRVADVVGIHLSCTILCRRLVEKIGFFNTDLPQAEDIDYLLRIFESGARFKQTDTQSLYHVRHGGNVTLDKKETARCFVKAIFLSIRRRRNNPELVLNMPEFELRPLNEIGGH